MSDNGNAPLDMSCSYTWVDTEPQLESLAGLLRREKVFAVDTEQHSFRSFLGFTALMQVFGKKKNENNISKFNIKTLLIKVIYHL